MPDQKEKRRFPCPVCMDAREVRLTKKNKPYMICDPCGIQLFVRGPDGISSFNRQIERAGNEDLWAALKEIHLRYRLLCPKCSSKFWIEPELVETSLFDGSLKGFRCPQKNCGTTVRWEKKQ